MFEILIIIPVYNAENIYADTLTKFCGYRLYTRRTPEYPQRATLGLPRQEATGSVLQAAMTRFNRKYMKPHTTLKKETTADIIQWNISSQKDR